MRMGRFVATSARTSRPSMGTSREHWPVSTWVPRSDLNFQAENSLAHHSEALADGIHVARAGVHLHATVDEHDHAVGQALEGLEDVRREEHRRAAVRGSAQQIADAPRAWWIETVERLVEHEHGGLRDHRARERRSAP